ncbi:MAG: hypothetical protein AAF654_08750 [Myxococcota bacterium]
MTALTPPADPTSANAVVSEPEHVPAAENETAASAVAPAVDVYAPVVEVTLADEQTPISPQAPVNAARPPGQPELRTIYGERYPEIALSPDTVLVDGRDLTPAALSERILDFPVSAEQRELIVGFLASYVHGVPPSSLPDVLPLYSIHDVQRLMEEAIGNGTVKSDGNSYLALLNARREAQLDRSGRVVNEVVQTGETMATFVARVVGDAALRQTATHMSELLGRSVDPGEVAEWIAIRVVTDNDLPSAERLPPGLTLHVLDLADSNERNGLANVGRLAAADPVAYERGLLEALDIPSRFDLLAAISRSHTNPNPPARSAVVIRQEWDSVASEALGEADSNRATVELTPLPQVVSGERSMAATAIQHDTLRIIQEELSEPLSDPAWMNLRLRAYYATLEFGAGSSDLLDYMQEGMDQLDYSGELDDALNWAEETVRSSDIEGVGAQLDRGGFGPGAVDVALFANLIAREAEEQRALFLARIHNTYVSAARYAEAQEEVARTAIEARIERRLVEEVQVDAARRFNPNAELV